MDYTQIFEISASGMQAQKTRLEVAAYNLANINTVANADGTVFQPLKVVTHAKTASASFATMMDASDAVRGVTSTLVSDTSAQPRLVHEPAHPQADANGMVRYPGVNHLEQMMVVNEALRAYEANVAAMQTARAMATRALDIGSGQ